MRSFPTVSPRLWGTSGDLINLALLDSFPVRGEAIKEIFMKTVEIYTDGEDGFAASKIKSRPARRLRGNRRTWQHAPSKFFGDKKQHANEDS